MHCPPDLGRIPPRLGSIILINLWGVHAYCSRYIAHPSIQSALRGDTRHAQAGTCYLQLTPLG